VFSAVPFDKNTCCYTLQVLQGKSHHAGAASSLLQSIQSLSPDHRKWGLRHRRRPSVPLPACAAKVTPLLTTKSTTIPFPVMIGVIGWYLMQVNVSPRQLLQNCICKTGHALLGKGLLAFGRLQPLLVRALHVLLRQQNTHTRFGMVFALVIANHL